MRDFKDIEKEYTRAMKSTRDEGDGVNFKSFINKDKPLEYSLSEHQKIVIKFLSGLNKTIKVLELGGCTGRLAFQIANLGYNIVSTDCVSEAISLANNYKSIFPLNVQEKVIFKQMFTEKITEEDSSFDVVVACEILEHVVDIDIAIKEIFRVLKTHGILVFTVPYKNRFESEHHVQNFNYSSLTKLFEKDAECIHLRLLFYKGNYWNIFGLVTKGEKKYV